MNTCKNFGVLSKKLGERWPLGEKVLKTLLYLRYHLALLIINSCPLQRINQDYMDNGFSHPDESHPDECRDLLNRRRRSIKGILH